MHDRERIARNDRRESSRNLRGSAFDLTHRAWLKKSSEAFREHVGPGPGGAKKLAAELECSEKTTQNWLDAKNAPAGILDLRAMMRIPTYAALKREIADMEMNVDPRLQAKYRELHELTLKLANGGA